MAYEKQTWTTGEVITQEKLNHMEDGIANVAELIYIVEFDIANNPVTASKTRGEIMQALNENKIVLGLNKVGSDESPLTREYSHMSFYTGNLLVNFNETTYVNDFEEPDSSTSWRVRP